jgi:hypothetical protein
MRSVSLDQLESVIRDSWGAETSHSPSTWSKESPAAGQCWTTAYVLRHYLGGEILIAEIEPRSNPVQRHAWNRLPSGAEVDLTREQLLEGQTLRLCDVPESIIAAVSLKQAECLLGRVDALLENRENDG